VSATFASRANTHWYIKKLRSPATPTTPLQIYTFLPRLHSCTRLKARNVYGFFVSETSLDFPNGVRMKIRLRLMAKHCRISLKVHTGATLFILIALANSYLIVQFIAPFFQQSASSRLNGLPSYSAIKPSLALKKVATPQKHFIKVKKHHFW